MIYGSRIYVILHDTKKWVLLSSCLLLCIFSVTTSGGLYYTVHDETQFSLVGDKYDVTGDHTVNTETGQEFAREHGLPFFETSTKEGISINQVIIAYRGYYFVGNKFRIM